jgi:hypothetical protein
MLLIGAAAIGLAVWRFAAPESAQAILPHPVVSGMAQINANPNSAAVGAPAAPVVAPVTDPVAAPVAESVKESAEDLHDHDEQAEPPSQATIDAIREMKKPMPNEGQVTQNPDGSVKINLGNRFQSVPIATIGKDGKVHVDYHGEKYLQDDKKPEEQKQETPTP